LLRQAEKTPATAQAAAQVKVDIGGHGPISPCLAGCPEAGRLALQVASTMPRSRDGGLSVSAVLRPSAQPLPRKGIKPGRAIALGTVWRDTMGLGIIGWIVIGIVAGWLAEKVMGRSHGLVTNLIVGVVGALIGGFIAENLLGQPVGGFNLVTLLVAFLGACLLLFLLGLVKRRG
jgi:uncharacterized membrane protein YeaQ/YmgE (transglycosylase-associated protein family)